MNAGESARGLSAAELALVVAELQSLCGTRVLDVTPLITASASDDLLLVLQHQDGSHRKTFVHAAPGGTRARITETQRRFAADTFARGTARDLLQREIVGATLMHIGHSDGERRCAFLFRGEHGERRLVVELFGARGLWALLAADGRALVLSRVVETAVRTLRLGDIYTPPPVAADTRAEAPPRFPAPVMVAVDAFFGQLDDTVDGAREHDVLTRAAQRALHRATKKVEALGEQLADTGRASSLRSEADLMLAYAHSVRRGATHMEVPDPNGGEQPLRIELDASQPVITQAQSRYQKARRLDDGRTMTAARHAEAMVAVQALEPIVQALAALDLQAADRDDQLAALRAVLQSHEALPKPPKPKVSKVQRHEGGENFRRFVSAEGYPIYVGRNNEQNDRLTMRFANGNDLWLHVGGGRPGSHVVIRLPKLKTASLETLLDAATLAVHFSKARGEARIDVVYTHKKHVRKPKGLPAGAVVPSQTKSITVHHDEARLRRLLDSAAGGDD